MHLKREIDELKKMISSLGAHVEEALMKASLSIEERDADMARQVIEFDPQIDDMEVRVEEECLKALALYQPVAADLRFIIAVLKVNNDLERIGDLAANTAEQGEFLADRAPIRVPYDLRGMCTRVQAMLQHSLDALMNTDAKLAREVRAADDNVDEINRQMYQNIRLAMQKDPERIGDLIRLLKVSHNMERVADHATNIAEDVIYLVEGEIIRHTGGEE